jgi:hypothetical protein
MAALIMGCFHLTPKEIEEMEEDIFFETWGRCKYYLETVGQTKFN